MSDAGASLVAVDQAWEEAIEAHPEANFLQSHHWAAFQERLGKVVVRETVHAAGATGLFLAVKEVAKRGTYLTIAGGPLLDWSNQQLVDAVFSKIKQVAKQHSCQFVRFRPQVVDAPSLRALAKQRGWVESPMHVTADLTLQLDLTLSEEELLAGMRKNHRYSIRKAEKDGVVTSISTDVAQMHQFYQLQAEVAKRHAFVPFSEQFLTEQFAVFAQAGAAALVHAHKDGQLLASAFIIFYNHEAVYHYGVSTELNTTFPGSYAAQWAAIKEAKARGCTRYNFWGIAPADQPQHRFAGVSLFKRGFGGSEVPYLPAHDIVLTPKYWLTYGFEWLRKKTRKL